MSYTVKVPKLQAIPTDPVDRLAHGLNDAARAQITALLRRNAQGYPAGLR